MPDLVPGTEQDLLVDSLVSAPPAAPGAAGWKVGVAGLKSAAQGLKGFGARLIGDTATEATALEQARAEREAVAPLVRKVEDVSGVGEAFDFAKYGIASALPSMLLMFAGGAAGRLAGSLAARRLATEATKNLVKQGGMIAGAGAGSLGLEVGSIFPEAVQEGVESPVARSLAGGTAAAALDVLPGAYIANRLGLLSTARREARKAGFGAIARGAAGEAGKTAIFEGVTEAAQEAIERAAAGKVLDTPEAISEYLNAGVIGALGGGAVGGAAGVVSTAARPIEQPAVPVAIPATNVAVSATPVPAEIPAEPAPLPILFEQDDILPPPDMIAPEEPRIVRPGPEATAREEYQRTASPFAEDADRMRQEFLTTQQGQLTEKIAALEAEKGAKGKSARPKSQVILEQRAAQNELAALAPELARVAGSLKTRQVLLSTPSTVGERHSSGQGIPLLPEAIDTTPAETAIAQTKRQHGLLVSSREAQLAPITEAPALVIPELRAPRETIRQANPQERRDAIEGVAVESIKKNAAELSKAGGFRKGTAFKAREAIIQSAVDAAQAPTLEEAQTQVRASIVKALGGNVNKQDAETFADAVAKDIGRAPSFYSRGAAEQWRTIDGVAGDLQTNEAAQRIIDTRSKGTAYIRALPNWQGREFRVVENERNPGTFLIQERRAVSPQVEYVHWGGVPTGQLDPTKMGTGVKGADWAPAQRAGVQYSSAVVKGVDYQERAVQARTRYEGTLAPDKVYIARGSDPLLAAQRQAGRSEEDAWAHYMRAVKEQGYDAMLFGGGQLRIFTPQPVKAVPAPNPLAVTGTIVNIGLKIETGGEITADEARAALNTLGTPALQSAVHQSETELTLVAVLPRALTSDEANKLAVDLKQQAIVQVVNGRGELYGPMAAEWGPFNPDLFYLLDGRKLSVIQSEWGRATNEYDRVLAERGEKISAHLRALIGKDPGLEVKLFLAKAGDETTIGAYTRVDKDKAVVALALNAKNELSLADHEGFHYLEDQKLDPHERAIIARAFKSGSPLYNTLMEKARAYDRASQTTLADEIAATPAEARAYGFEFWRRGELQVEGALARIFRALHELLQKIVNFIDGQGFKSVEDVFSAIDRGSVAQRERTGGSALYDLRSEAGIAPWYRSELREKLAGLATKSASAQGWKEAIKGLKGVKQDEIEWSGLQEWLDLQQGRVTKEQVLQYLDENGVRVEEVELGEGGVQVSEAMQRYLTDTDHRAFDPARWGREAQRLERRAQVLQERNRTATFTASESVRAAEEVNAAWELVSEALRHAEGLNAEGSVTGMPKFAGPGLNLPGGKNYRELLLTLPQVATDTAGWTVKAGEGDPASGLVWEIRDARGKWVMGVPRENYPSRGDALYYAANKYRSPLANFQSAHFDEPNILAHVRFNERTDSEGKRVLFLEELQSDWAQKGRKEGLIDKAFLKAKDEFEALYLERSAIGGIPQAERTEEHAARARAIQQRFNELHAAFPGLSGHVRTTPAAPFVGSTQAWTALVLKRMIRYGAENGFERIAWTTGSQQVARYESALRKAVDSIEWTKTKDGVHLVGWKGRVDYSADQRNPRTKVVDTTESESALSDAIGKSMAEKIRTDPAQSGTIEGENLKIDDTGMAGFYDRIVPSVAKEVLRKLGGGKVGEVNLGVAQKRDLYVTKTNASTWQIYDKNSDSWLGHSSEQWVDSPVSAKEFRSESGATQQAMKLQDTPDVRKQPGFDLTPALAREAARGLPLFSRAAASDELLQRFKAGELPIEQQRLVVAGLLEDAGVATPTLKQFGLEGVGSFRRWLFENVTTGNYTARFSKGYKNVMQALSAYSHRKQTLISEGSLVGLSEWHKNAGQDDITVVGRVLLARTDQGLLAGSPELAALLAPLTELQRKMYDQATIMIAGRLQHEFEVEKRTMAGLLPAADYQVWETNRASQVEKLQAEGYVPERRYGDHVVHIYRDLLDERGRSQRLTLVYEQYEHQSTAEAQVQRYQEVLAREAPDLKAEYGYRYKADRDTSLSIQQFLDTARRHGVVITQAEKERLAKALVAADSIRRNRMFRRKNIPGYSEDIMRVLNEFVVTTSNKVAYAEFSRAINDATQGKPVDARTEAGVVRINTTEGNLWQKDGAQANFFRNISDGLVDYVLVPDHTGTWSKTLRGATMMYFLGGSLAAGAVNAMSVPMNTVPWLSQSTSYTNAFATTLASWKDTMANQSALRDLPTLRDPSVAIPAIDSVPGLRQALIAAAEDGRTLDTEIHQIMGVSQGGLLAKSRKVQKAMQTWMFPFRFAEQTNRIATFITAYKIGQENKLTGRQLYEFAAEAVDNTQNVYSEVNRPGLARHPVWALLFMFKSFPLFTLEMLHTMYRQNPKSAVYMLLGLTAMTGVNGLPFAETLLDLIDTISQRLFGSPFNARRAMRNVMKDASEAIVGVDLSEVFLRGTINAVTGMNVASRIGLGDFVPGTRIGAADNDYARTMEQVLGAPIAMATDVVQAVGKLTKADFYGALREGGPSAARNAIKAYEQMDKGFAVDARGQKLVDVSGPEAFWQALGFSSASLAKAYDMDRIDKQTKAFYAQVRADFTKELVQASLAGDSAKAASVYDAMRSWNESYPDMPLALSPGTLRRQMVMAGLPLNERTQRLLPRQLRGTSLE